MTRSVAVLARVSPAIKEKLEALAKGTRRAESTLAAEAIAQYVETKAWQKALVEHRLAKARSRRGRFVPHDEAMDWFMSLGSERPLPKPKGRRLSDL
jgi:predicted transcriptional regulator